MTWKSKRTADIHTDRDQPDLPILNRILPVPTIVGGEAAVGQTPTEQNPADDGGTASQSPANANANANTNANGHRSTAGEANVDQEDPRPGGTDRANGRPPSFEWPVGPFGRVSINPESLVYDRPKSVRSWRRRLLGGLLPTIVTAIAILVAATPTPPASAAAADSDSGSDLAVKSARFDLADPEDGTTTGYRSIVVVQDGLETRLSPLDGPVRVTMTEADASVMGATVDGIRRTPGEADFTDTVAAAISSPAVSGAVDIGQAAGQETRTLNVFYRQPLNPDDFLMVQEGGGDGLIEVSAVDGAGTPIGTPVTVGPPYQLNTGHTVGASGDAAAWASVVPVADFGLGPGTAAGVQVRAADVQVKVAALVPDEALVPSGLSPAAETSDVGRSPESVTYASVGLEAKVQPALAVDGAGCLNSPAGAVSAGQAVTFCYLVTNLGTTDLVDIRITDAQLGLIEAELPIASGQPMIRPNEQVVLYHHAVAEDRPPEAETVVTARPVDANGDPVVDLVAPSGTGSPGGIGAQTPAEDPVENQAPVPAADNTGHDIEVASTENPGRPIGGHDQAERPTAPLDGADTAAAAGRSEAAVASGETPTQLAMTGIRTEPWIMVILAMGLIFIGYTATAAFGAIRSGDGNRGHQQLDQLGFE